MFEVRVKDDRSGDMEVKEGTTFTVYDVKESMGEIYFLVYYYRDFFYLNTNNFE